MKSNLKNIILVFLFIFTFNNSYASEQFTFDVTEIQITENGNKFIGTNRGRIQTNNGIIIKADEFIYNKELNILDASGNVQIEDKINNYFIYSNNITYNKNEEIIFTRGDSKAIDAKKSTSIIAQNFEYDKFQNTLSAENNVVLEDSNQNYIINSNYIKYLRNEEKVFTKGKTSAIINEKYNFNSKDVTFLKNQMELLSNHKTTLTYDKNLINLDKFRYFIKKQELIGEEIIISSNYNLPNNDKFYFSNAVIDLKNNNFIAKDTEIKLHKNIFDNSKNDPRLKGVSSNKKNNITIINKGIFTSCKKTDNCPPWSIQASEIKHDKNLKQMSYKNALIKIYDVPVLYFPKFFHPDPTVKRQTGFLKPEINDSKINGTSITTPYFFDIANNKDFTFKPTWFGNNFFTLQNEFRSVKKNYNLLADFGYVNNYNSTNQEIEKKKNFGHIFANLDLDLDFENFNSSKLFLSLERVSNDLYLKIFDAHITKSNAKPEDINVLNNKAQLELNNDNFILEAGIESYETLGTKKSDRYQYVLPYYNFSKNIYEDFANGSISFDSSGNNDLSNTNVWESTIINDLYYNSKDFFSDTGMKKNFNIYLKNFNSYGKNSSKYSSDIKTELMSLYNAQISYPLIKNDEDSISYFTPKLAFNFSPNGMKNYKDNIKKMDVDNIFNMNRLGLVDTFESGKSLTIGFDYKKENSVDSINKYFELKLAKVLRDNDENFIPKSSGLNKKNSNIFGSVDTSISENLKFDYNFALDNNLSQLEYTNLNSTLKINNFTTTLSLIKETGDMGDTNVLANSIQYKFDENNYLKFNTRRNRKIDLTEYYDLVYEYKNDCLTAAVKYKKTYYEDSDLKPEENLLFAITLYPLTNYEYSAADILD